MCELMTSPQQKQAQRKPKDAPRRDKLLSARPRIAYSPVTAHTTM
jgi:hypothetical protein